MDKDLLYRLELFLEGNESIITRINAALAEINGRKNLPLWLEDAFNGPLSSISADALQGLKAGMRYTNEKLKELLEEDN